MLKTERETIDGIDFTTTQLPAMKAFKLLARLTKVAGPVMAALSSLEDSMEIAELAPVLANALSALEADELSDLAVEVLKGTSAIVSDMNGSRKLDLMVQENIDLVFSGRLLTMMKVLIHAIKVNYHDFLEGGLGTPEVKLTQTPSVG